MPELASNQMLEMRMLETVTFLSAAGQRAHGLNDAIANLPSAFAPRTAVSSNTNLLTISSFSGQGADTSILIRQIATTQRNEGAALNSSASASAEGVHKFALEVDGEVHELSFTVDGPITNRQFQQRMAETINSASLGISATINTTGSTSRLVLETGTTGPGQNGGPRFTIRDISGQAVSLSGVQGITQQAQSAVFSVNGGANRTQATNRVDLGDGLVVNLVAASESEEAVSIFMGQDRFAVRDGVRQVVNQFNALFDATLINAGDRNTRQLIRELQNTVRSSRRELERVGIRVTDDGTLSIDESALNRAMDNGDLTRFFQGTDTRRANPFTNRLARIANSVIQNPMSHVSSHARRLPGFDAAMNAVNNSNNAQAPNQPSPFDAYSPDDIWNILFDALR